MVLNYINNYDYRTSHKLYFTLHCLFMYLTHFSLGFSKRGVRVLVNRKDLSVCFIMKCFVKDCCCVH